MMDYFDINMDCIKENRNKLYEKLQETDQYIDVNKSERIQSVLAKNGELFLALQKESKEYRMNSSYSPKNEAEKWVEQYSFINMSAVITMFGFGTGTFVREIAERKGKKDTLIIYEPSPELFVHVLHNYDITDIIKEKLVVLSVEGINEFEFHSQLLATISITNINSQIRCTHPYYEKIFPESAIKYWKEIKDTFVHAKMNINTERFFGKRFITNSLYNARYMKESNRLADVAEDFQTDIPAIIVAAGPSLKENIEELKRVKGRAYIFVVDRILDYILDSGVEPDFIVTVDPIKPVEYFTKRTDVTIPLLCEMASNWEVLNCHKGKKIIYSCSPFFQKMYQSQGIVSPMLNTGASVATTAFSACVQLGFKRIILVGQDLAYDGDTTHAGGIAEKLNQNTDVFVDGIDGSKVRSRHDWYEFLNWFKDMIILFPDIQVIDVKAKGAKISGATVMPIKEAIDTYCTKEIENSEVFRNKKSTFNEDEMNNLRKFFSDTFDEISTLVRKSKEAIRICEDQIRIYKRNSGETPASEKNFKKISKINKYISLQPSYLLIETFITSASAQQISELYQFTDDMQQDKIVTYQKSISIFQAIIDGTDFLKPLFDEMLEFI